MNNVEILFLVSIVIYSLLNGFDKRLTVIRFRFKERNFALKYPKISSALRHISIYSILISICAFIMLQYNFGLLRILLYTDPLILTVAIYTMYGIYISFVQFLISYSASNGKDLFWGKSKTKLILMDTIEYRVFNSTLFRVLFLYLAFYSIMNFQEIYLLKQYHSYADSLFYVAIAIIITEYIFLFIKGLIISNLLFHVQEDVDRITRQVKTLVFSEYLHVFNRSLSSDDDDFVEWLFYDVSNIEYLQREEMVYQVMNHIYSSNKQTWEDRDNRVANYFEMLLKRFSKEKRYHELHKLKQVNRQFWRCYERSELKLPLDKLVNIYLKQENFVFNFMKKESDGNREKFSILFETFYKKECSYSNNIKFPDYPDVIWNTISSPQDIILLSKSVRKLQLIKCLQYLVHEDHICCTSIITERIKHGYSEFLISILKRKKELIILMKESEIGTLLALNKCNANILNQVNNKQIYIDDYLDFGKTLEDELKATLVCYIRDLDNNKDNQDIIKKIAIYLDIKYIMFFICYRVLYTGPDETKWKSEITFFKDLIFPRSYNEAILTEENIYAVSKLIENYRFSNIGHRISSDLICWILNNLKSPINEMLVKECNDRPYLNLSLYISFRYIFRKEFTRHRMFEVFESLNDESRVEFIVGISKLRNVMCEDYFVQAIYESFGYQKNSLNIDVIMNKFGFEAFMTVANFVDMGNFIDYIGANTWTNNNNAYLFLLMMFGEFDHQKWLLSIDVDSRKELARHYEIIISQSNKAPEDFVDELENRALRIGINTPPHRREKIVDTLKMLILQ